MLAIDYVLPLTAAPIADPSSITTAVAVAAPSTATAVAAQTPAAAAGAAKRAAMERIRASALQLAREIRKPRTWIGYVAFVLFALLKKKQTADVGGSKQVLCHRDLRALGPRHVHKGVCIRSNPMRIEKQPQRCHRVRAN